MAITLVIKTRQETVLWKTINKEIRGGCSKCGDLSSYLESDIQSNSHEITCLCKSCGDKSLLRYAISGSLEKEADGDSYPALEDFPMFHLLGCHVEKLLIADSLEENMLQDHFSKNGSFGQEHFIGFVTKEFGERPLWFETEGDCCSETWFSDILNAEALKAGRILKIVALDTSHYNKDDGRSRQESDQVYGFEMQTLGGTCTVIFRNSSNGYYGGSLNSLSPENPCPANIRLVEKDYPEFSPMKLGPMH